MSKNIILKQDPKIEFQLMENGFQVVDAQSAQHTGFYSYSEVQSIALNKAWYPRFAKWTRAFTWILNGVPFFPDADTCKKASLVIRSNKSKLGIWLTDTHMADQARTIAQLLNEKRMDKKAYSA